MGKEGKKEVMKLGSWEDGKKGEKGSFENRKLGRWEKRYFACLPQAGILRNLSSWDLELVSYNLLPGTCLLELGTCLLELGSWF